MTAILHRRSLLGAALTGVLALLVSMLAPLLPPPSAGGAADAPAADRPVRYRTIPTQVFEMPGTGRIAVGAPSLHRVMIQHQDPTTGVWGQPEVLYQRPGIECGDLSGSTSAGGVALLLECDRFWAEDQAPVRSVALVSRDLTTWAQRRLPGEAYLAPGISPGGGHAVWLAGGHGDFVRWSAGEGFAPLASTAFDYDSGDPTAVVADDGTVTVLGAEPGPAPERRCVIGVHSMTVAGERRSDIVDPAPGHRLGCTELSLRGLSSTRVEGEFWSPADTFVIGRDDESAPWRLLEIAPSMAPGLVDYAGPRRRAMPTVFSWAEAGPMVAVGSPDRQRVLVQLYDAEAQSWGPPREVYDHGFPGCTWDDAAGSTRDRVHHLLMHCYPRERADGVYPATQGGGPAPRHRTRVLLSHDSLSWLSLPLAGRPLGVSARGGLVAAPQARRTTVVSTAGVVRLPYGTVRRCDAVHPVAPDRVVRLHATRGSRGWPSTLQERDDAAGWRTLQELRVPPGRCRSAETLGFGVPSTFLFRGERQWHYLRVVRGREGWRAVRTRGY